MSPLVKPLRSARGRSLRKCLRKEKGVYFPSGLSSALSSSFSVCCMRFAICPTLRTYTLHEGPKSFFFPSSPFLPAAKPSGPRTVRVVLLVVGGKQFDVNLWLSYVTLIIFLWGGIHHSLNRFRVRVEPNLSISSHVFAAAGL